MHFFKDLGSVFEASQTFFKGPLSALGVGDGILLLKLLLKFSTGDISSSSTVLLKLRGTENCPWKTLAVSFHRSVIFFTLLPYISNEILTHAQEHKNNCSV